MSDNKNIVIFFVVLLQFATFWIYIPEFVSWAMWWLHIWPNLCRLEHYLCWWIWHCHMEWVRMLAWCHRNHYRHSAYFEILVHFLGQRSWCVYSWNCMWHPRLNRKKKYIRLMVTTCKTRINSNLWVEFLHFVRKEFWDGTRPLAIVVYIFVLIFS